MTASCCLFGWETQVNTSDTLVADTLRRQGEAISSHIVSRHPHTHYYTRKKASRLTGTAAVSSTQPTQERMGSHPPPTTRFGLFIFILECQSPLHRVFFSSAKRLRLNENKKESSTFHDACFHNATVDNVHHLAPGDSNERPVTIARQTRVVRTIHFAQPKKRRKQPPIYNEELKNKCLKRSKRCNHPPASPLARRLTVVRPFACARVARPRVRLPFSRQVEEKKVEE